MPFFDERGPRPKTDRTHYAICLVCPYVRTHLTRRRSQRLAGNHERFHAGHAVATKANRGPAVRTY